MLPASSGASRFLFLAEPLPSSRLGGAPIPCHARVIFLARCAVMQDVYYATPGQMGSPTHRLPGRFLSLHAMLRGFSRGRSSCHAGIVSCDHRSFPYNHAAVKLTGAILPGSRETM